MERYTILDHTADGKFRAFGETLEEAFANAALAVASLMWSWERVAPATAVTVEIGGRDREQLLYRFLEEILYLLDTRNFLLAAVEGLTIRPEDGGYRLRAVFRGERMSDLHDIFGSVKAVTYNEMKIEHTSDRWTVQVVVDM